MESTVKITKDHIQDYISPLTIAEVKKYGVGGDAPVHTGDLNTVVTNSLKYSGSSSANKPDARNGFFITQGRIGTMAKQMYFPYDNNDIFVRTLNSGTWGAWVNITSSTIPKEHQINGTRHTANITGTFNFDWNAYSQFVLTPLGATVLGNDNLPTGTNSKEIKGIIKAGSVVTKPANWVATADSDAFDNTLDNHFRAWVSAENVVTFTNKNKAVTGGTGTENIAAGAFTGVLNVSGGNRYYDDYTSGAVVNLSLSATKALGATATVRIKGGLIGTYPNTGAGKWNFSGQPITTNTAKLNELSLLYVREGDVRIVNRIVDYVDMEAPTAPTNLTATNTTDSSTDLSWTDSSDSVGVTGYNVYQDAVLIDTVVGTSKQVTGLTAETTYAFTVTAIDAAGNESNPSNAANVTTEAQPASLTPAELPTLDMWYDGTDAASMTLDGSNNITAFTDKAGNYNLNKANGTVPKYDSTGQFIDLIETGTLSRTDTKSTLLVPNVDFHGFFIFKNQSATQTDFFINTAASNQRFGIGLKGGKLGVGTYNGTAFNGKAVAFTDQASYHVLEFKQVSGVITANLDHVVISGSGGPNSGFSPSIVLGGAQETGANKAMDFRELFVQAGEMTQPQRDGILQYISNKHGL